MVVDTSMKAEIGKLIAATILYSFVNSIVSRAWRVEACPGCGRDVRHIPRHMPDDVREARRGPRLLFSEGQPQPPQNYL